MARISRVVIPEVPHHVIQRGNRRQRTFFLDDDYRLYQRLMSETCSKYGVDIWAYCLMPNHVHLVAVPSSAKALASAVGEAHRRYTVKVNKREGWSGYLWQGRFASYPMDEGYLYRAVRYIERNPVAAEMGDSPERYPWSSARPHLEGKDDLLVRAKPMRQRVGDWKAYWSDHEEALKEEEVCKHEKTGRPAGPSAFVSEMERRIGRSLIPRKRGRKNKKYGEAA